MRLLTVFFLLHLPRSLLYCCCCRCCRCCLRWWSCYGCATATARGGQPAASTTMSVVSSDLVRVVAESVGIAGLPDETVAALLPDVEHRVRDIIKVRRPRCAGSLYHHQGYLSVCLSACLPLWFVCCRFSMLLSSLPLVVVATCFCRL